jgi:hypothetical protein
MTYIRPEHEVIADVLRRMDHKLLQDNKCFFGGGTAIVLRYGEYRQSLDVDFLCYSQEGYRELRTAITRGGPHALIPNDVEIAREHKTDGYGIRMFLRHQGQPIKFEIVKEGNIDVTGAIDPNLGVPILDATSMFATKLLANADRWADRSTACRDAIDLGMLIHHHNEILPEALGKAIKAYGEPTLGRGLIGAVNKLSDKETMRFVAQTLDMTVEDVEVAANALRLQVCKLLPKADIVGRPVPPQEARVDRSDLMITQRPNPRPKTSRATKDNDSSHTYTPPGMKR